MAAGPLPAGAALLATAIIIAALTLATPLMAASNTSAAQDMEGAALVPHRCPEQVKRRLIELPAGHVLSGTSSVQYNAEADFIQALHYSMQEDLLFVGGTSGTVQLWRGLEATLYAGGDAGGIVSSLTYLPGYRQVVAAREDGKMRFLQVQDRAIVDEISENAAGRLVTSVQYVEYDDDVQEYAEVASASADNTIKLWDARTRTKQRTLEGHTRPVLVLRFFAVQEILASGGFDGLLGIWRLPRATRLATGKQCAGASEFLTVAYRTSDCLEATSEVGGTYFSHGLLDSMSPNSCELHPDGCEELNNADYTLYRIGQPQLHLVPAHDGAIRALEVVSELGLLASSGDDGLIKFWEPLSGTLTSTIDALSGTQVLALLYISGVRAILAATGASLVYFDGVSGDLLKTIPRESGAVMLSYLSPHQMVAVQEAEDVLLYPVLEPCIDGQQPRSPAECELCPQNKVGSDGFCSQICPSATTSSPNRTVCVPCPPGSGGTNGFCEPCEPGRYQNAEGTVGCKRCQKGTAQPFGGMPSCVPCLDNMVAEEVGQEECEECPDGTEPSAYNARCTPCPEGSAGTNGVCFQCDDGEQPNDPMLDRCIPCPPGTAGFGGFCELCPDGQQPAESLMECEPCPPGFAGTKGFCARCLPGQMPAEGSEFCMLCPRGESGTNGTCSKCPPGFVPNEQRTECYECPDGQPSVDGVCTRCLDGTFPAENRSSCLPCPPGYAGKEGLCAMCPFGMQPNVARSECVTCPETSASAIGICFECVNGTQPNATRSGCEPCPPGTAGTGGRCLQCNDGDQQDQLRVQCEPCPIGLAGTGGLCDPCEHPLMPDTTRTVCTKQVFPPYMAFSNPRCRAHPVCNQHFSHVEGLENGSLFCCPTSDGDLLRCCEFENAPEELFWKDLALSMDQCVRFVEQSGWFMPLLSLLGLGIAVSRCYYIYSSDAYEEWRANLIISPVIYAVVPLLVFIFAVIFPWLLVTVFITAWMPIGSLFVFIMLHKRFGVLCDYTHDKREKAVKKMRWWMFATCAGNIIMACFDKLHDWVTMRFLLADMSAALSRYVGFRPVVLLPYEEVVDHLLVPRWLKSSLHIAVRSMRVPEVILSNTVVHIDLHTENFTTTLVATTCVVLGLLLAVYLLLAANLILRLDMAKQSVLLTHAPASHRARRLAMLGFLDFALNLMMHWAAIWPSRMCQLLVQLASGHSWPQPGFPWYVFASISLYVVVLQGLVFYLWISIASGAHVENPPQWLAARLEAWCGVQFDEHKREQYLVQSVLKALDLYEEEDEEEATSPRSPRSPGGRSSGRSPGRSPRTSSPRSPNGRRGSRGGFSPRGGSAHSGGGSWRSPRGSARSSRGASPTSGRSPKVMKNLGSATTMLQRHAGIASPRSNGSSPRRSPGQSTSPSSPGRSGASPRSARLKALGVGQRLLKFVRMPDGTRSSLSPRRRSPNNSPRNRSGNASPTSPGRSTPGGLLKAPLGRPVVSAGESRSTPGARSSVSKTPASARGDPGVMGWLLGSSRGMPSPADSPMHSKARSRMMLSIDNWVGGGDDQEHDVDVTGLRMTPQQLYNRVPPPPIHLTARHATRSVIAALRTSLWTSIGHWKEAWNVKPHRVRVRTRDMAKETFRGHYDMHDYVAVQRAMAKTISVSLLWLPCGIVFAILMHACNHPPLRQCDHSLNILRHKIEEYIERGMSYKEAESALRRFLVSRPEDRIREVWSHRLERVMKVLSVLGFICLAMLAAKVHGDDIHTLAPALFSVGGICIAGHALLEHVILPRVRLQREIQIAITRDVPEEKKVNEQVAEALGSSDSSITEASSSDYSSANESFLDEDPRSEAVPTVLGTKRAKIIVRPKAVRLKLRFQLLRGTQPVGDHSMRWQREDPLKHGRLLQVPDAHLDAMRLLRTVSFRPTEESDWPDKVIRFGLRRSNSLGTATAEEVFERRLPLERWGGFVDIFDEQTRDGVPDLPETDDAVAPRGLIDIFEERGVFREAEGAVSNKDLLLSNPFRDTVPGDRFKRALQLVRGAPQLPPKPWEVSFDEALAGTPFDKTVAQRKGRSSAAALGDAPRSSAAALKDAPRADSGSEADAEDDLGGVSSDDE